jgi:hypothetical protein
MALSWPKENSYDIYGATKDRGIVLNYPSLIMYLSAPDGNLYRRNREDQWDAHQGAQFLIGNGYYSDPKFKR